MKIHKLLLALLFGLLVSCSDSDDDTPKPIETDAKYMVSITGAWTGTTHPTDYPSNSHFSPFIGMSHKTGTSLTLFITLCQRYY